MHEIGGLMYRCDNLCGIRQQTAMDTACRAFSRHDEMSKSRNNDVDVENHIMIRWNKNKMARFVR
jgi:uncharacterized Fe-S cluster-containing radical SAM superfamily enzyme